MRRIAVAACAALFASSLCAATSPLWGNLEAGPYAVGFQQWDRYDYTRPYWTARDLEGKARTFERARPMRISIWYPAVASDSAPLTFGDYVSLMGSEDRLGPLTAEQKIAGRTALYRFPTLRDLSTEQRAKLEALPTAARLNATPASGKFPLILYSLGSAAPAHVTPEYLASHGYVVMQMPRVGGFAGMPPDTPDGADIDLKVHDTDFLLQTAHDFSGADIHNIGAIGFSAGGRWALSEAMKNRDVHAVVSLDSVMLFNDGPGKGWKQLPFFSLEAVRIPVLHMIRRAWVPQEDASMWQAMRYADRTAFIFEAPGLDHLDFQGIGYETTLAGGRPNLASQVTKTFNLFHRYTLAFLDANLKNDSAAKAFLAQPVDSTFVTAGHLAATPAPPTLGDVMNSVAEGNVQPVISAVRAGQLPIPEDVINLAGYNLLGAGRTDDAIKLFQLNIDAHPMSANAYDSLGDAYAATGDAAKAAEVARKAAELLESDTAMPPDRKQAIRQSIEQKLAPRKK